MKADGIFFKTADRPVVLCIEDEPTLLSDLCVELREAGYHAMGAPDVASARKLLDYVQPEIILCDIAMPGATGLEFLSELRQSGKLSEVPFLFLTAQAERENVLKGKLGGADDYLVKPVDYEMLLATLSSRLAQVCRLARQHDAQLERVQRDSMRQWTAVLDKVSQCALVCDARLNVRFANRAAFSLCHGSRSSPLMLGEDGRIVLHPDIAGNSRVAAFLRSTDEAVKVEVAADALSDLLWQVTLLTLQERVESEPCSMVREEEEQCFVVFLSDMNQRQLHNKAALAQRFQLTPMEVQVASMLTDGLTKQEMGEQLGVSLATVAYHLRNLFHKSGTKRQAELVALMMTVAWNDIALPVASRH